MPINANHVMLNDAKRFVLLRQDVDRLPQNSLAVARIQKEMRIQGTFYFRIVPQSFDPAVIDQIAGMGHSIGYHYEDLNFASAKFKAKGKGRRAKGEELEKMIVEEGIRFFAENLQKFRRIVPVNSICMHGSPMSRWDSRLLWKYYDYREFGIENEPYFDVDFSEMLYLTDTGRRWDGGNVSVRDKGLGIRDQGLGIRDEGLREQYKDWVRKPIPGSLMNMTAESTAFQAKYNFRTTNDIIRAAEQDKLPDRMMMTFHPQRWTDKPIRANFLTGK